MWEKFKNSLGVVVAAIIGLLSLLFIIERDQKESVEEKLLNKDVADKDVLLKQQQTELQQDSVKAEQQATEEKKAPMTQDETTDMLNKL